MDKIRKANLFLYVGFIIFIGLIASTIYFFNYMFPKAEEINLPKINDIISISLNDNKSDRTTVMNDNDIEKLFEYLYEGEPTRKQAMNDYPTEKTYYSILVQTAQREYRYFVYEKYESIYIEVPYEGIYESKIELFDLLLKYYQE